MFHRLPDIRYGKDADPLHHRRFMAVGLGDDDLAEAVVPGRQHHGQHAADGLDRPVEGKLADDDGIRQRSLNLSRGRQQADGDGQVVGRALLAQVGGGQVHGDALHGVGIAAVFNGGVHPLLGFLDARVGQPDHGVAGQPVIDVHFHGDDDALHAEEAAAVNLGQHQSSFPSQQ